MEGKSIHHGLLSQKTRERTPVLCPSSTVCGVPPVPRQLEVSQTVAEPGNTRLPQWRLRLPSLFLCGGSRQRVSPFPFVFDVTGTLSTRRFPYTFPNPRVQTTLVPSLGIYLFLPQRGADRVHNPLSFVVDYLITRTRFTPLLLLPGSTSRL